MKATKPAAVITENDKFHTPWTLDHNLKYDTYVTGKTVIATTVLFQTDVDTLEFELQAGDTVDFVVILDGTDSCFTRLVCPPLINLANDKALISHTIPFEISPFNNILFKTVVNQKDTLSFLFDSGAQGFYMIKPTIRKLYAKGEEAILFTDLSNTRFDIGDMYWENEQIYPIEVTGQQADGMFGWDLFDGLIVQLDYEEKVMKVTNKKPVIPEGNTAFPIDYDQYYISINLDVSHEGSVVPSKFLVDLVFQKTVILDQDLYLRNGGKIEHLEVLKKSSVLNSRKEEIPLLTVKAPSIKFGSSVLPSLPADINSYNKPTGYDTHFLGSDVLKRFHIIFDFQNHFLYLKPNQHFNDPYFE